MDTPTTLEETVKYSDPGYRALLSIDDMEEDVDCSSLDIYFDEKREAVFIYNTLLGDPVEICDLEQWFHIVKAIKENTHDPDGRNILTGLMDK